MILKLNCLIKPLKRLRNVFVYLPDDYYYQDIDYPVLYFQDGQNAFFDHMSYNGVSWGLLDYAQEFQWNIIIIAIYCNFEGFKRMDEYGPWPISSEFSEQETGIKDIIIGGEGIQYIDWIINDLKPYIDRRFQTNPHSSAIVGSSMGAVISAYAALKYPYVFNKCAALSTAFWLYMDQWEQIINSHHYEDDFRFYFDLGECEGCGNRKIDQLYIESNNEIKSLLQSKINNLEFSYFENEYHNEEAWKRRVPAFMKFLFGEDI